MGHAGCGKTSLLSYLAQVSEIPKSRFRVLNIHSGTRHEHLEAFVEDMTKQADEVCTTANLRL
jgi:ABC-type lipoprotein export system ATPase subunit